MKRKLKRRILSLTLTLFSSFQLHAATPASSAEECKKLFDDYTYKLAIPSCTQAAKGGDSPSQTMLGEMFDQQGDSKKTALWWNKAAAAGYQPARNLLALKYYYGGTVLGPEEGWIQDYNKAFKIWMDDSKKGVATSQFMIGIMYQKGLGVPKDLAEAYFWLKVALANGYKLSTDVLIEISRDITPQQKKNGEQKLREYKKRIAS